MRFAVDTGGTFTDLVLEEDDGAVHMFKAPTTPDDPVQGIMDAVAAAAQAMSRTPEELLGAGEVFIHGTTHAIASSRSTSLCRSRSPTSHAR